MHIPRIHKLSTFVEFLSLYKDLILIAEYFPRILNKITNSKKQIENQGDFKFVFSASTN